MMEALEDRGLGDEVFLWSDDNLSGDFFWTVLSDDQRERVRRYPMYSRVACFKGFDEASFHFNTMAAPEEFERQFLRFRRYVQFGLDIYAYVTLTSPDGEAIAEKVARFVDRLQVIHPLLPLKTVPLEIKVYTPVESRLTDQKREALRVQYLAIQAWKEELSRRFTPSQRRLGICDVRLD